MHAASRGLCVSHGGGARCDYCPGDEAERNRALRKMKTRDGLRVCREHMELADKVDVKLGKLRKCTGCGTECPHESLTQPLR
jgi:hypothetical protein